jgi:hypothetical protein
MAEAHCNLGHALAKLGRFAESLAALRRGHELGTKLGAWPYPAHELGTKRGGWPYPSAEWVRQAEQMVALEGKLPAFLKGAYQPRDTAERLGLARVCHARKLHHTASRLYVDAFTADPKVADDRQSLHRYNAACHAALAAAGQGEDAARLDDAAKGKLRGQAHDWLKAELTVWGKLLDAGPPPARATIGQVLRHWQRDSDLAGLRDKAALTKLPADERARLTQLWADVAALLKKAEAMPK